MIDKKDITGIILAGGKSERMGTDKPFIKLNNKSFINHITDALKPLTSEIIIVSNSKNHDVFGFKRIADEIKNAGPLAGIYSGLNASKTKYNLVLSCDVPLINSAILKLLINTMEDHLDIIQLKSDEQSMPLIALYKKQCAPVFYKVLLEGERRLRFALNSCRIKTIVLDKNLERFTTNINTPEQLKLITNENNR